MFTKKFSMTVKTNKHSCMCINKTKNVLSSLCLICLCFTNIVLGVGRSRLRTATRPTGVAYRCPRRLTIILGNANL